MERRQLTFFIDLHLGWPVDLTALVSFPKICPLRKTDSNIMDQECGRVAGLPPSVLSAAQQRSDSMKADIERAAGSRK